MVNYITTMFLGKPPGDCLVFTSINCPFFWPVTDNLLFLTQRKREYFSYRQSYSEYKSVNKMRAKLKLRDEMSDLELVSTTII